MSVLLFLDEFLKKMTCSLIECFNFFRNVFVLLMQGINPVTNDSKKTIALRSTPKQS